MCSSDLVIVRTAGDKNDLKIFYDILVDTAERDDFLIRDYTYFEAMWTQLVQTGLAEIFIAETEETGPISATLGLIHGRKFWYLYGASSNDHRNLMPNYLIQWYMINWARERGCTLYDFRGVSGDMDETNPLYGLCRFVLMRATTRWSWLSEPEPLTRCMIIPMHWMPA